jgi:GNAT superfamily N-acetyltransferase
MTTLRRIGIGEGPLFRKMRLASLRESPSAFTSTYESALLRSAESWSEQANSTAEGADRATVLAYCGDRPIGIAALYRVEEGSGVGVLLQMWVAPDQRRLGVASALLDALFDWAKENGFREVIARVAPGNERALRLYHKYGFRPAHAAPPAGPVGFAVLAKRTEPAPAGSSPPCPADA